MSDLDISAIKKLKVAELKAELSKRGLAVKGKKDDLAKRLIEAIEEDSETVATPEDEAVSADGNALDEQTGVTEEDTSQEEEEEESPDDENTNESTEADQHQQEEGDKQENGEPAVQTEQESKPGQDDWVMVEPPSQEEEDEVAKVAALHPTPETSIAAEGDVEMKGGDVEAKEGDVEAKEGTDKAETSEENKGEASTTETKAESEDKTENKDTEKTDENKETSVKKDEPPAIPEVMVDIEVEEGEDTEAVTIEEGHVGLDAFTSDLNFIITENGLHGRNLVKNGFNYLWAGARANKGAKAGKVGYEVKIVKRLEAGELDDKETPIHAARVGWSVENSSLQLGEQALSYGYESTGKVCASSSFFSYGETFDEGDVIGTYMDLESEKKTLRYTKNGVDLGVAMTLNLKLDEKSLFPHLFIRNMEVELNFGGREEPWFPVVEEYSLLQNAGEENISDSTYEPPATKEECEILLMVGLPNAGKTTWVRKYVESHAVKRYTVVGMSDVLERCKLEGKKRKKNDSGHDNMMKAVMKVLTKLYELCPKKNRNYIYDQNNCYQVAQSSKMAPFAGFKRKAIIVVPTHDNLRRRTSDAKRKGENIHDVPFADLCDMKCEFHLPEAGDLFDEVVYPELDEKNALKTAKDYQSDGARAKKTGRDEYYPRKRPRSDDNRRRDNSRNSGGGGGGRDRDGWKSSGSGYGGGSYKGRDNNSYGSGYGGGNRSNYQDPYRKNSGSSGGGYRQHQGYGGGSSGGYRGGGNYSSGGYGGGYGGYGGSYGSSGYGSGYGGGSGSSNYNSYGSYNQSGRSSGGQSGQSGQWAQYGQGYNASASSTTPSQSQWGANQGSWGGYNYGNYNSGGNSYGGSGYSY